MSRRSSRKRAERIYTKVCDEQRREEWAKGGYKGIEGRYERARRELFKKIGLKRIYHEEFE